MDYKDKTVYVKFKGEYIPLRADEMWMWEMADFKQKHAHYNQWKHKLKTGQVVKIKIGEDGFGFVTKEYALENNCEVIK
jgi:hypothetical protein